MSLYHEAAELLSGSNGGSLQSVFKKTGLKKPPAQIYALAIETCKWSAVFKEVIENAELLIREPKLTPTLSLVLVHDFLLAKAIVLPQTHVLRAIIERHKARLTAEFTRARVRRKCATVAALRALVTASFRPTDDSNAVRWVRVNALKSTVAEQLATTFREFTRVATIADVIAAERTTTDANPTKVVYVDEHVPFLLAVPQRSIDLSRTPAYKNAAVVLQNKASCFPAELLQPEYDDVVVDACAAPGNKTTHVAAIMHSKRPADAKKIPLRIVAFEKDKKRAATLTQRIADAGADGCVSVRTQDFLATDPMGKDLKNVTMLLLDPSCSGSGIVNRDFMPELHLPEKPSTMVLSGKSRKKKGKHQDVKPQIDTKSEPRPATNTSGAADTSETARIAALAAFQLSAILHAFSFPSARRVTYSTCSVHDAENEHVVVAALASEPARARGWRPLLRAEQPDGLRAWHVRGRLDACGGDEALAEACLRSFAADGRGSMGFFVIGFVRD